MHEFSLAQGLCRQLLQIARENGAERILRVGVEIGRNSGIVVDSFTFGFEILAQENELTRDAVLAISESEPKRICTACGEAFPPENGGQQACPRCGSRGYNLAGGDDIILTQVEME